MIISYLHMILTSGVLRAKGIVGDQARSTATLHYHRARVRDRVKGGLHGIITLVTKFMFKKV